jgi:RNA polymerase sigma factor (TIGR02999 family)
MPDDVTTLLGRWADGDRDALDRLMPLVYEELHRIAHAYLRRERPGHALESAAIVNEAYLRLIDQQRVRWQNRTHFYGVAAQLMRRILVDHARAAAREKRGGGAATLTLDEAVFRPADRGLAVIALDDALQGLARLDARQSRVVELRFFGGLSIDEAAEVLGISRATAHRDWVTARAWLIREMGA